MARIGNKEYIYLIISGTIVGAGIGLTLLTVIQYIAILSNNAAYYDGRVEKHSCFVPHIVIEADDFGSYDIVFSVVDKSNASSFAQLNSIKDISPFKTLREKHCISTYNEYATLVSTMWPELYVNYPCWIHPAYADYYYMVSVVKDLDCWQDDIWFSVLILGIGLIISLMLPVYRRILHKDKTTPFIEQISCHVHKDKTTPSIDPL